MNADRPIIDISRVEDLRDLFQAEFADALTSFVGNAERYISEIGSSLLKQDFKDVEHNAHKLKSSAAMFGAERVSEISIEIEDEARQGNIEKLRDLYSELLQAFSTAKTHLGPYLT